MEPLGVTPHRAAELSSLPLRAIYTALSKAERPLPSAKIGRRRVILLEDLRAWLRAAGQ